MEAPRVKTVFKVIDGREESDYLYFESLLFEVIYPSVTIKFKISDCAGISKEDLVEVAYGRKYYFSNLIESGESYLCSEDGVVSFESGTRKMEGEINGFFQFKSDLFKDSILSELDRVIN